ncbi:toprim domain-containing protein [Caulobacter segnis]
MFQRAGFHLDDIKSLPILDIAARLGVKTLRGGRSARCPFPGHTDANPSFSFYPGTNSCWCHGCGRGGDVINFVALQQGIPPKEAIRWLRAESGLPTRRAPRSDLALGRSKSSTTPPAAISNFGANAEIYEALLDYCPMQDEASAYLLSRGFKSRTVSRFRLGYLANPRAVARSLIRDFGLRPVYRSGLLSKMDAGASLLLPGRSVIFPFIENRQTIYVQSRLIPGAVGERWKGPRGVPRPVFNSGVIARSDEIYICEGAADVLAAFELKMPAIGLLGGATSLPESTVNSLKGKMVYVVPDNDDQGSRMSAGVNEQLHRAGIHSLTKTIPTGKDINEYLLISRTVK